MNSKQLFWVIKNKQPVLLEGEIKTVEGNWVEFEEVFNTTEGQYHYWFNTEEEAIQHELELAEYEIEFETEMWESTLQVLIDKKNYWANLLKEKTNK